MRMMDVQMAKACSEGWGAGLTDGMLSAQDIMRVTMRQEP